MVPSLPLVVLLALLAGVFLFLSYYGFLHTPKISVQTNFMMDTIPIWYKFHVGPMMEMGERYCELTQLLSKASGRKIVGMKRFVGLFYDDNAKVKPENLRWAVGVWEADTSKKERAALAEAGFKRFELAGGGTHGIKTRWRLRPTCWRLSVSSMITSCYPVLYDYCAANKVAAGTRLEFYGVFRRGSLGRYIPVGINLAFENKWMVDEAKGELPSKLTVRGRGSVWNFFVERLAQKTRFPKIFSLSTRSVSRTDSSEHT